MTLNSSYLINEEKQTFLDYMNASVDEDGIVFKNFNLDFVRNFIVNAIVDLISTSVSEAQPVLDKNNGFWEIINYPNPRQTWRQFIYEFTSNYLLNNVAYIYQVLNDDGTINCLYNFKRKECRPENIGGDALEIESFVLNKGLNNTVRIKNFYSKKYDLRNKILMWTGYNSLSSFPQNLPPEKLMASISMLDYIKNVENFNNKFFKNVKPGYVLKAESKNGYSQKLNDQQKEKIRQSFYSKNSEGRLLILEDGYTIELIGNDLDKMNFANAIKEYASLICSLYRVPPEILYLFPSSQGQYKANEETRLNFYYSRIIPLIKEQYELFNKFLVFRYNPITNRNKYKLTFDETKIPVIEKDKYTIAKLRTETGSLTLNELRANLDKKEVEYGDKVYMSKNFADLETIVNSNQINNGDKQNEKQTTNISER